MVDSKDKGTRAETQARDILREYTGLQWERVPGSGALDPKHKLKGDLYLVNRDNVFAVEVKHYAADNLTSKILTDKTPVLLDWWNQTIREAAQVGKHPLLLFKFDRSKWFMCVKALDFVDYSECTRFMEIMIDNHNVAIFKLEEWLKHYARKQKWVVN